MPSVYYILPARFNSNIGKDVPRSANKCLVYGRKRILFQTAYRVFLFLLFSGFDNVFFRVKKIVYTFFLHAWLQRLLYTFSFSLHYLHTHTFRNFLGIYFYTIFNILDFTLHHSNVSPFFLRFFFVSFLNCLRHYSKSRENQPLKQAKCFPSTPFKICLELSDLLLAVLERALG